MTITIIQEDIYPLTLNEEDPVKSVRQNVLMVLATIRGSVPLYRDFGLSAEALDKPINVARTLLISDIRESIEKYEPRATVKNIRFVVDAAEPSKLKPVVEVEINE